MDFFQLLRVHLEHQSLVRLRLFALFFWCMVAFTLVFNYIADRLDLLLSVRRGITRAL